MLTSKQCLARFGVPERQTDYMMLWSVPLALRLAIPALPPKVYCHRLLADHLQQALERVASASLGAEIKTWDGCFNIRWQRRATGVYSLHSWGLAIDINAQTNQLGQAPTISAALVFCFTASGFDWGGKWQVPDGMHFQLRSMDKLEALQLGVGVAVGGGDGF